MLPSAVTPVCKDVPILSLERRVSPDSEGDLFTLILRSPGWVNWHPGQFVMVRPQSAARADILWARPFSISRADEQELRLVFQVVGRGTKALLECERGELVTVWGPLGNAFSVSQGGPTLLLAGGIGIAPFVGYIERHPMPETLRLEFGHRLPLECYPFSACLGAESAIQATNHQECHADDLTRFITVLDNAVRETARQNGLVLACGPMPFLCSVQKFALQYGARAELSLETRMACGIGACLGCVVKSTAPNAQTVALPAPKAFEYVQTCTRGPVFRADAIDLEKAS